ncbi:MAG: hypothetical protein AAGJ08_24450 [Cyanobacteria bacterium P01_H01_bin.35]
MEDLTVSPENRLSGEVIDKKWVIIDLIGDFGISLIHPISPSPHLPISPSPHLSPLFFNRSLQELYLPCDHLFHCANL